MTEHDLIKAGFTPQGNGSMTAAARIVVMPTGEFYRLTIEPAGGGALTCHIARLALKTVKPC